MTNSHTSYLRRGGTALLGGAVLTVIACIAVMIERSSSNVAHDLFRYPLSHNAFVSLTLYAALTHVLIGAGLIWLRQTGVTGRGRAASVGLNAATAGTALLCVCELASLPISGQHNSDTWPTIVDSGFGLATVLLTGGMLAVGIATVRERSWSSWRRNAPLICGLLSLTTIPLQFTSALEIGIALYGVGYAILGFAMFTDPAAQPSHAAQLA
jgi:succinate dehydrogenase hydrophobic anchor subunit